MKNKGENDNILPTQKDITEFNKSLWVESVKNLAKEQLLNHKHLRAILGNVSEKTLGYYLNKNRTELPKLPEFTKLFQYLNTTSEHLLLQRGPREINPSSNARLMKIMEKITDTQEPSLRILISVLTEMEQDEVDSINKILQAYRKLPNSFRKKVLHSIISLIP